MSTTAAKIISRVRAHNQGPRAFTPKDFLDLASRSAVDQALLRLVKAGKLRRIGRGLYDRPRHSTVLGSDTPASLDAVVAAVARRAKTAVIRDDLAAANAMGLTTAVPTRPAYVAARKIGDVRIDRRMVRFSRAQAALIPWIGSPAAPIVQALLWAHATKAPMDAAAATIARHSSREAKAALARNLRMLPAWAIGPAQRIAENRAT